MWHYVVAGLDESQAEGGLGKGNMQPTMLVPVDRLTGGVR